MKTLLLVTAAALALGTGLASAADLPARMPVKAAPIMEPAFSWTGFYLGANLGGKWGRFDETLSATALAGAPAIGFTSDSQSSIVGGGQLGYMWQTGQFVFGVEGDIDGTGLRRSATAVAPVVAPFVAGDSLTVRNDWQASARGRLGLTWDRTLLYVTGGGSWANLRANAAFVPAGAVPGTALSIDRTLFGWTVGGGVDFGLTQNWSLGAEYRFTRYDTSREAFGPLTTTAAGATTPINLSTALDTHEVTARLNYHFSVPAPVTARY